MLVALVRIEAFFSHNSKHRLASLGCNRQPEPDPGFPHRREQTRQWLYFFRKRNSETPEELLLGFFLPQNSNHIPYSVCKRGEKHPKHQFTTTA